MGKISRKRRSFEIKKKQKIKKKLKKLRRFYLLAKTKEEKEKNIERINKLIPHLKIEDILKE